MSTLSDTVTLLKKLRANVGYGIFDSAVRILNRERLNSGTPQKRKRLPPAQKKKMYARQDGKCARCKEPKPYSEMTDDHFESIANGGGNELSNRRLVCKSCNSSKGDRTPFEESKLGHGTVAEQLETVQHED